MSKFKLRRAQREDPSKISRTASYENPNTDFVPFIGYYNRNTIITKNGELMKVIRITGFNHENISSEFINLRETIRDTLLDNIKSDKFALWISTIRRKKNIAPKGEYQNIFTQKLNSAWHKVNKLDNQYVNELYITVIIEGYDTSISNVKNILNSFSFSSIKKLHKTELEKSYKELNTITTEAMKDLNHYGAKILGVNKFGNAYYSEPMRFFGKIINLNEDRYPLTTTDMSEELVSNYGLAVGNNNIAVSGNDTANYACMLSVKEYQEISVAALDNFLQLPQEFIVTQSIDFISRKDALIDLDYQNYILDVSDSNNMRNLSGLKNIIGGDSGSVTDYGKQQITIMLINKTSQGLSQDLNISLKRLQDLGLVTVREDIFTELCFWSQLPGNFSFLRRQKPINIGRIGGFASLHNFPAGNLAGNHWGDAVTVFRTIMETPYFFNFHNQDNGHTMIIGPKGSGKTILLNFLIAQAEKFNSKLYYFGYNKSGKIFINAIEGNYLSLSKNLDHAETLRMCPLSLKKTDENRLFLHNWFVCLTKYGKEKIVQEELDLIPNIVDEIIKQNIILLSKAAELFNTKDTQNIYKKLQPWHSGGKYSFLFDHEVPANFRDNRVNAIDLSPIIDKKPILIPVITYLLRKIENSLDGSPSILVLDEAWELLDNYALGPDINNWLKRMKEKNCMIILATKNIEDAAKSDIHDNIATQIFLPNPAPNEYYKTVFGLSDEEYQILPQLNINNRQFLLKHADDTIISTLDLSQMMDVASILAATPNTLYLMNEIKKKFGKKSEDWVPHFLTLIKDLLEPENNSESEKSINN